MSILDLFDTLIGIIKRLSPKKHSALVVEDNMDDLEEICTHLEKLNINFETSGSAEEAMGKLSHKEYSIIFVDLRLPLMSGMNLITRMLDEIPNSCIVIVLTQAEDLIMLPHSTFVSIIIKPVSANSLRQTFSKLKII